MKISVVIPTNKSSNIWMPLLRSIARQTKLPFELVFLIDRQITHREFDLISREIHSILDETTTQVSLISHLNTTFLVGQGASYVRNYGAQVAGGEMIQYMDDDGIWTSDYLERMAQRYDEIYQQIGHDLILSPTIMYRDTGMIQSQGFDRIWRALCRPQPHYATDWKARLVYNLECIVDRFIAPDDINSQLSTLNFSVSCIGAMGLFAPRELFQVIGFDEQFEFVYEDLDFTLRAHGAGVPVIIADDIRLIHMETPRTSAQRSYIGSPRHVYLKSRNRIFFARNNASPFQQFLFYIIALPLQSLRFFLYILISGSRKLASR